MNIFHKLFQHYKVKPIVAFLVLFNITFCFAAPPVILIEEDFDNTNFSSRGWYDNTGLQLSTSEHAPGSTSSVEYRFSQGAQTPPSGGSIRKKFPDTDEVYISYYVKYSANWEGSNRDYHPHEFFFLTNVDGDYSGLSTTHLTAYVEQNEGTPLLSIQDSLNIDESNYGVDLTNITENRAVSGCNGTINNDFTYVDCYGSTNSHRNGIGWKASGNYFQDTPGPYYKNDWHKVEAYYKMNTIENGRGIANGIVQYWYDGELLIDKHNVLIRTAQYPNMEFDMIAIAPYIGDGSPVDQTMWVDTLIVATSRINNNIIRPKAPTDLTVQ